MKLFSSLHVRPALRGCLGVLSIWAALAGPAWAANQTPSPHPDPALIGPKKRVLMLELAFGPDGRVTSCRTLSSSGSAKLDKDTIFFIKQNWVMTSEAGKTARVPLDFNPAPAAVAQNGAATNAPSASRPVGTNPYGLDNGANAMGGQGGYGNTSRSGPGNR